MDQLECTDLVRKRLLVTKHSRDTRIALSHVHAHIYPPMAMAKWKKLQKDGQYTCACCSNRHSDNSFTTLSTKEEL